MPILSLCADNSYAMPCLGEACATGDVHGSAPYALAFPAAAFRFSQ